MDSSSNQEDTVEITKGKVINSVKWSAIEKYSSQGIQFLVSIVMARLLTPAEYGIIAIIGIFLSIANMVISSGLERALIHKQDCETIDYSTANVTNIAFSLLCYAILFAVAPYIADFYKMPVLTPTMRVLSLTFIFGAISGVSRTILTKKLQFKKMSLVTLATSIFSGIIGILLAYRGLGVWALVYQSLLATIFSSIWIMVAAKYLPSFRFSRQSFNELFGFGAKMLGSDLIWVIFANIHPMIIGKFFNAQSVGYFGRAHSYATLIPANFNGVLEKVLFPVFATLQNDEVRLKNFYTKALTLTSTLVFTGNFFLIGLAYPLIIIMITEKWVECVPLLQILCLSTLFNHINSINGRLLIAKGFPGVFLKMSAITTPLTIIIIFISIFGGLKGLAWGSVATSFITTCYSCYVFKRYSGINPLSSMKGSFKILLISSCIGLTSLLLFKYLLLPTITNLIITGASMAIAFLIAIKLLLPEVFKEFVSLARHGGKI